MGRSLCVGCQRVLAESHDGVTLPGDWRQAIRGEQNRRDLRAQVAEFLLDEHSDEDK
jgi:predicted Fe-S protein YdhL (DUF1289 family)